VGVGGAGRGVFVGAAAARVGVCSVVCGVWGARVGSVVCGACIDGVFVVGARVPVSKAVVVTVFVAALFAVFAVSGVGVSLGSDVAMASGDGAAGCDIKITPAIAPAQTQTVKARNALNRAMKVLGLRRSKSRKENFGMVFQALLSEG